MTTTDRGFVSYDEANRFLGHEQEYPALVTSRWDYLVGSHGDPGGNLFMQDLAGAGIKIDECQGSIAQLSDRINKYADLCFSDVSDNALNDDTSGRDWVKVFERLIDGLRDIGSVNSVVRELSNGTNRGERAKYVADSATRYFDAADINIDDWVGSIELTLGFIEQYAKYYRESIARDGWHKNIDIWRRDLVSLLESDAVLSIMSAQSAERAVRTVSVCPVEIGDPLLRVMSGENGEGDFGNLLGMFNCRTRTIKIDPFSIASEVDRTAGVMNNESQSTLVHEFIHSISADVYKIVQSTFDAGDQQLQPHRLWPRFWNEGMAEKLTEYIMDSIAPEDSSDNTGGQPGGSWQLRYLANPPKEARPVPTGDRARKCASRAYPEYRTVIDAVIDRLDWQAAGLAKEEAFRLACYAFSELPEDGTDYRVEFIQAINQAAHTGFFMKLANIIDLHGEKTGMRILLDPNFDPHDASALKYVAGVYEVDYIKSTERLVQFARQSLERVLKLGGPKATAEYYWSKLEGSEPVATKLEPVIAAVDAQQNIFMSVHPDPYCTPEERLLRTILGGGIDILSERKATSRNIPAEGAATLARLALLRQEWHKPKD